jgi:hypothetical protein
VLRLVAAAGIPGVIAGSIAGNDAVAITFGGIIAAAAFGLILVTAVTTGSTTESLGASLESQIDALVARGASEAEVRALVAVAIRLGAGSRHE